MSRACQADDLRAARGIAVAVILSAPVWAAIIALVWWA